MVATAFSIRELSGSERSVELRGRSLPYRPVGWPGTQHHTQVWYPGNPQATIHVLGAREDNTAIEGTWKDRYLLGAVTLVGFDDIPSDEGTVTARALVEVFHRLRRAGNFLEVQWGPEVRRGIMARFEPNYLREEDVRWSAEFVWSSVGDRPAVRASEVEDPTGALEAALAELDDTLAERPSSLLPTRALQIIALVTNVRAGVVRLLSASASINSIAPVEVRAVASMQTTARAVIDASRALMQATADEPYAPFVPVDVATAVVEIEVWRRTMNYRSRGLLVQAVRALEALEARTVPDYVAIIDMPSGKDLRDLSTEYYGTPDDWTVIADANRVDGPEVAAGFVLVIPRSPNLQASG